MVWPSSNFTPSCSQRPSQEELDAYESHQRMIEDALDSKTAALIHLQKETANQANRSENTVSIQSHCSHRLNVSHFGIPTKYTVKFLTLNSIHQAPAAASNEELERVRAENNSMKQQLR